MSATTTASHVSLPNDVESPRAKLVYLYLQVAGEATATELRETLGVSKLAALGVLDSLESSGHVRRTENGYACS
ncbi:MarR family transcriptional regulator [Halostella sp. JP-L12]|uniref:helix-turn-helix domain-containing protein n=1 Tax=Halostella TaxID=1843185 RepID=UPI000EF827F9|nr:MULTISPECIES: helix-turn-helix domain-containing protein [Halostella]NHN49489.1 MarR family transcriptional regulator [Halostella sp. JP-L12]